MHDLGFEHMHMTPEQEAEMANTIWAQDNVELTTVGVDVGSSTSHLMFAKVHLQRLSEGHSSRFVVVNREVLWRSPILLTPYRPDYTIDSNELKAFFEGAFRDAGLRPDDIDTGAVILTGEALKRVNARAIADLFAEESGKFVCASAGHHLEAVMAAHGSGAVALSRAEHKTVLNVDIGGGTVKLALAHGGRLLATSAFAVGGRLVAFDAEGRMERIEGPAEQVAADIGLTLKMGETLPAADRKALAKRMVQVICAYANRKPDDALCKALSLVEALPQTPAIDAVTFSGGVSEFIYGRETEDHGDLGLDLANELRHQLGHKTVPYPVYDPGQGIRATVVGASQFTVQVSGNTIFISEPENLPIRNVPVARLDVDLTGDFTAAQVTESIRAALERLDMTEGEDRVALAFNWGGDPLHARLHALASGICAGLPKTVADAAHPLITVMDGDAGKTLGNILSRELGVKGEVISIDNVHLHEFDFIDIGEVIEATKVVPLIIKSLLFATPATA
jgi:ethanolamine utilization protein EutA